MWLIRRLHKWSRATKGENIYKEKGVQICLLDLRLGSAGRSRRPRVKNGNEFPRKDLCILYQSFPPFAVQASNSSNFGQSTFSPLAATRAIVPSTPIFKLAWRCAKAGSSFPLKCLASWSNLSGRSFFGKKCGKRRSNAVRADFKHSRAREQFNSRTVRVSRRWSSSKSWFLV